MEPEKKIQKVAVETYAGDMAEVLGNDKEGLIKKIIQGAEETEAEKKNLSPESKKNRLFLGISLALMVLGIGILAFLWLTRGAKTVPVEQQFIPLIFNDKTFFTEVSQFKKEEIEQTVLNQINNTTVKINGIEGIYLTRNNQKIGLREFLTLIKSSFAPNPDKTVVSDDFLMGVVNAGAVQATAQAGQEGTNRPGFFILIKARTVADIFDALRAWEPKMFLDLSGFLGVDLRAETTYLVTKNFEDGIVENKNVRLLRDRDGAIVLMYIFMDDNSVLITNSENAVHEIHLRLASKQTKQ